MNQSDWLNYIWIYDGSKKISEKRKRQRYLTESRVSIRDWTPQKSLAVTRKLNILGRFPKTRQNFQNPDKAVDEDQSIKGVYTEGSPHTGGDSRWRRPVVMGCFNLVQREEGFLFLFSPCSALQEKAYDTIWRRLPNPKKHQKTRAYKKQSHPSNKSQQEREETSSPLVCPTAKPQKSKQNHFMSRQEQRVSHTGKM